MWRPRTRIQQRQIISGFARHTEALFRPHIPLCELEDALIAGDRKVG